MKDSNNFECNSVKEDIDIIEYNMKIIRSVMNNFEDKLCENMQIRVDEVNKSIEHILSDYKRVLKENEELKEYNIDYKRILDLADNRTYRKKYLEERRKEQPNLLYPDGDEIYQRYYELQKEIKNLTQQRDYYKARYNALSKIVDSMAKHIYISGDYACLYEECDDNMDRECEDCIKEYFYKKVKETKDNDIQFFKNTKITKYCRRKLNRRSARNSKRNSF